MDTIPTILYPWRAIAFEGGGVTTLGHIGVIKVLDRIGILPEITHFSGTSAGSLLAILVSCRVSYSKIEKAAKNLDLTSFEDSSWCIGFCRLVFNFGWNSGDYISNHYSNVLEKCGLNPDITFSQIRQFYGTSLIITSTNLNTGNTVYYTPDTHPHMSVVEAARESSTVPLLYSPVVKDGNMYVDGGLTDPCPIKKLYEYVSPDQVIGVKLIPTKIISSNSQISIDIISYTTKILTMLNNRKASDKCNMKQTIIVSVGNIGTLDFNLSQKQKNWLIQQGEIATRKFLCLS